MITRQADLTALRDELLKCGNILCGSFYAPVADRLFTVRKRLTDLLGSLPPQEKLDLPDVGPAPVGMIATLREHVKRFRALGGVPEMCDLTWKLCNENEELKAKLAALGSLPVPDTEEPVEYTILVEREEDRYFASWTTGDGKEGGCANYSSTVVGALAELCSTLLKVAEDKSQDRVAALLSRSAQEPPKHENCRPDGDGPCETRNSVKSRALGVAQPLERHARNVEDAGANPATETAGSEPANSLPVAATAFSGHPSTNARSRTVTGVSRSRAPQEGTQPHEAHHCPEFGECWCESPERVGAGVDRGRTVVSGAPSGDQQGDIYVHSHEPPTWLCEECRQQWLASDAIRLIATSASPPAPEGEKP